MIAFINALGVDVEPQSLERLLIKPWMCNKILWVTLSIQVLLSLLALLEKMIEDRPITKEQIIVCSFADPETDQRQFAGISRSFQWIFSKDQRTQAPVDIPRFLSGTSSS